MDCDKIQYKAQLEQKIETDDQRSVAVRGRLWFIYKAPGVKSWVTQKFNGNSV